MDFRLKRIISWPKGGKPSISAAPYAGAMIARAGPLFSWWALAAILLGVMLARWTWLLFTPHSAVMPPAVGEVSTDAGHVFGTATGPAAVATVAAGNIQLVGVFANRTKGFAIMQVDGKQIGVAQGEDVKPGLRLAETHPDHVVLDQSGVAQRVDLTGAPPAPALARTPAITPQVGLPSAGPAGPSGMDPRTLLPRRAVQR